MKDQSIGLFLIAMIAMFFFGYAVADQKMNTDPAIKAAQIRLWDAQAKMAEAQMYQIREMLMKPVPGGVVYSKPEELEPVPMDEDELPEPTLAKPEEQR